jgi:hypothetical protein
MRLNAFMAGVAIMVTKGFAFENTSPFLFISNTKDVSSVDSFETPTTWSTDMVVAGAIESIRGCPYDAYIIVNQPLLHDSDLGANNAPHLMRLSENAKYSKQFLSLYSTESGQFLDEFIVDNCEAQLVDVDVQSGSFTTYIDSAVRLISLDFEPLPQDRIERTRKLRMADNLLYSVVSMLPSPNYAVFVMGGETTEPNPIVLDTAQNENSTSLFARYQFFSPGIFMGTVIALMLLTILGTALSWISGLQVSYKAFEPTTTGTNVGSKQR